MEQIKQPSALEMFEQIIKESKGKQIVMFLDYDGTLSPIVDDPDRAYMSDAVCYIFICFSIQLLPIVSISC